MIGTLVSVLGFSGGAWILSQGAANPPRASQLIWEDRQMLWASTHELSPGETAIMPSPMLIPMGWFSLEVQATLADGSDDLAHWAIWLETAAGDWLIIAISGAQYVTARVCPPDYQRVLVDCPATREPDQQILTYWKPFHHIRPVGQLNIIKLDYLVTGQLTLHLNGEWMWHIPFDPPAQELQWGVWMQGQSIMQWKRVKIWTQ